MASNNTRPRIWLAVAAMGLAFTALAFFLPASPSPAAPPAEIAPQDRPVARVVSPGVRSYLVNGYDGDTLLISLDVVDTARAGIKTDDAGIPRFHQTNRNVETFVGHLVSRGTFTNHLGQSVIQLVSEIPVDRFDLGEIKLSAPVDREYVQALFEANKDLDRVYIGEAVSAAVFKFVVTDQRGVTSDQDSAESTLIVGLASGLYRPDPSVER